MKQLGFVFGLSAILVFVSFSQAALVYDKDGDPSTTNDPRGYMTDVSDPLNGAVDVVVTDTNLQDNIVHLVEFDKTWLRYHLPGTTPGLFGLALMVQIDLPSQSDTKTQANPNGFDHFDIVFSDEQVRNLTGVIWWDFHITVLHPGVDVKFSGDLISPIFSTHTVNDDHLGFKDGLLHPQPYFQTLFQSKSGDPLTLRIDLLDDVRTVVRIKEFPTVPEPATMSLLALGGCSAAAAAAKRRPRKRSRPGGSA